MVRLRRRPGLVLAAGLVALGSAGTALTAVLAGSGPARQEVTAGLRTATPAAPTGSTTGTRLLSSPAPPGAGVPTLPPAQPEQPNVVHRDGRKLICPNGTVPMVQIQGASFSPELTGGTSFGVGRYRIRVTGRVANETTAPIVLRSLQITVDGRPWHQTTAVRTVPAQDFAPISFEGVYDSRSPHRAVVDSRLQWQWQEPALRPCGEEGLVEDD